MSVFFGCSIRNKVILTKFVKMSFQKQTVLKSFQVAFKGIFHMLRFERNFQIQIFALIINLFLIVIFKLQTQHAAIIILVCFSVLSAEIFNTAIERICDYIQPQYDKKNWFYKRFRSCSCYHSFDCSCYYWLLNLPSLRFVK